jgi:ribonuclease P protein component
MKQPDVLRKQEDFTRLYKNGKSSGSRYLVLLYRKNGLPYNRKAFLASKKVGNSVCRNRARRLMKEAFRHTEEALPIGYDFLLIARHSILEVKEDSVEKSLRSIFSKTGLMR